MGSQKVFWVPPLTRLEPWYPGQMGVHGSDNFEGLRMDCNGAVFYVDPNHADASDAHDGTNPLHPLATVATALTKVRAYKGDVIAVMGNSNWTYGNTSVGRATAIAETVTVSTPGIKIMGIMPSGPLGVPWVSTADDSVSITINAMDVLVEGFCFWDVGYSRTIAILAQWDGATYYGESTVIRNCYFYSHAYGVILDYAWNCVIDNCKFDSSSSYAIYNRSTYGDPAHLLVKDCEFQSNASAIYLPDADSCVIVNNVLMDNTAGITMTVGANYNTIHSNVIMGDAAGTNNFIDLSGGAGVLNMVSNNWLGCTVAQYDTTCSPGGGGTDMWVRNHLQNGESSANPT